MQEWVILEYPGLLMLCALSICAVLLDRRWQVSRGWLTWLGGALMMTACALLIVRGAALWEAAAWLTVFLLQTMGVKE